MVGEKISLRKRVGLAVLTVLMLLSAVFGAIFMRGIFGDTTQTANAEGVTVGATDNSQSWINSQNIRLRDGDSVTFEFDNYSNGTDVWFNWLAVVRVNDANNITLRADNYLIINDVDENGNIVNFESDSDVRHWNGIGITFSEGKSWDTFASDLNGAHVVMTFSRTGNTISMTAVDSKNSNIIATHTLNRSFNSNVTTDVFVTIDKAHLENFVIKGVNVVGATDFTTPYLGAYSNKVIFEEGQRVGFTFTNYSDKLENYHNWIACLDSVTDARIVMLRADNWENIQDANTGINSNYNWDTFKDEMNASYVTISFTHLGSSVKIRADIVGSSGTEFFEEYTKTEIEGSVKASLTVENSFLMNMAYTVYSTVTYNTNGGLDVAAEQYVTALSNPLPTPTREGYTFAGWFTNEGLTETATAGATITENTTLYAKWTINTNTVTFVTAHGNAPEAQNVEYNATATKPADPTANGYTFNGWYLNDSEYDFATPVTSEISLTANWTATEYSISYTLNGGEATNPTSYTVATETFTLTNPTKVGYTFAGWTGTDLDAATETVTIAEGSTGDREYTANWTPTEYLISYTLNGGEATNPTSYTIETANFTLTNPTKVGYTFAGWTGTDLDAETQSVTISAGSMGAREYTANWTEISATTISGHHVELGGDIGVTFTVQFKAGENEGSYMIFTFEDGRASQRVDTAALTNNRFSYTARVNAMELAETITATLYRVNAEPVEDSYSVMQYINAYKNSSIQTEKGVAILNALQNYGYYMQNSGWRDDLSDHSLIDQYSSLSITSSEVISALSEKAITKGDYTGNVYQSLTLNADTKINLYFEGEVDVVEGAFSTPVYTNSLYKSTSGSINILNLGENKTLKIQVGETQYTITVNGLSYLYAALNGGSLTTEKENALIAYYEYYLATQAF